MRYLPLILLLACSNSLQSEAPLEEHGCPLRYHSDPLAPTGCSPDKLPGEASGMEKYPEEIQTAVAEWEKVYTNACDPTEISVVVIQEELYYSVCKDLGTAGCFYWPRNTLVMREAYADDWGIVAHETMHWLEYCNEGILDNEHSDLAIWGKGGALDQAMEILREREE